MSGVHASETVSGHFLDPAISAPTAQGATNLTGITGDGAAVPPTATRTYLEVSSAAQCFGAEEVFTNGRYREHGSPRIGSGSRDNSAERIQGSGNAPCGIMKTETIIQRLERVLSLSGTTSVDPHFITDVILPEVLIQWLQTTNAICRFQAEDLLMKTKPFIVNEGKAELAINGDTPKESSILEDTRAAAEWVKGTMFEGMVKVPSVLSMDEEEQQEVLEAFRNRNDEHDYYSTAEHLSFVFEYKNDYDKFCSCIIDEKNLKVFCRFEVQD